MSEPQKFAFGDPVWYRQVQRGGYGFANDVPATFVCAHARRVSVRVILKDGSLKQISVSPQNVRPRDPQAVWR